MNSEMLGISFLQIALGKTDHLVAHINTNDKEPSWDGDVEVYSKAGHVHAKSDLLLKVPVQVKGHCKPNLKKKSIKYSIQYADLRNYLYVGGTIFFVVYVNDSGDRAAIYYVKLLPYDLKKHLKTYDGTPYKEKSIELKEFPKKKNDITDVFLDFVHHMNLQRAAINSAPISFDSLRSESPSQLSNIQLTIGYSAINQNYEFPFDYFFTHDTYIYIKQPHDIELPVAHLKNVDTVEYTMNAPISVKSNVFFDHYTVSRTKTSATIKFGADIRQVLQAGTQAKPDFHFSLSGSLSERIRDARFILAVLDAQQYEINGGVLNFKSASFNNSGFVDRSVIKSQLDFMLSMQKTLNLLHVKKDLNPNLIDTSSQNNLNILKTALLDKKAVKLVPYDSIFRPCRIANLNLLLCTIPIEGTNDFYDIYDFNQAPISFKSKDSSNNDIPFSYFVLLDRDIINWCDNINYDSMIDSIKAIPLSVEYSQAVNTLILEMLHAYDSSDSSKEDILLAAIKITDWIRQTDMHSSPSAAKINYYQAIKRSRPLTSDEQTEVLSIVETERQDESIYVGAYLLLDNIVAAKVHFSKLSKESQEAFKKYPIYRFMQDSQ